MPVAPLLLLQSPCRILVLAFPHGNALSLLFALFEARRLRLIGLATGLSRTLRVRSGSNLADLHVGDLKVVADFNLVGRTTVFLVPVSATVNGTTDLWHVIHLRRLFFAQWGGLMR
jgi:hypothetical protein